MEDYKDTIVTLQVEEGQTNDKGQKKDPVASYCPERGERYLVFLPKNAPVGQQVRVKLENTARKDKRGEWLYRGQPTNDYINRWKDNQDGTATLVTYCSDWTFAESEEGEVETRALETREEPTLTRSRTDRTVVLGTDLVSSVVVEKEIKIIPTRSEYVTSAGTIEWKELSAREEVSRTQQHQVIKTEVKLNAVVTMWDKIQQNDDEETIVIVHYDQTSIRHVTRWDQTPSWVKDEFLSAYPICVCNRNRRNIQVSDGYDKCELCRAEEICVRCGKKAKIENLSGRFVCSSCKPYESAEQLVSQYITAEHKLAVATEANKLLAGKAIPRDLAEALFKATLDHITEERTKDRLLQTWLYTEINFCKRQYWYFCKDGVYGSLYSPAALMLLERLPEAKGNGLVDLAYWLATEGVYYMNIHVENRQTGLPSVDNNTFSKLAEKLETHQPVLAAWLRGPETERKAVADLLQSLKSQFGDRLEISEAGAMLQAVEQNYGKALSLLQKAEQCLASRQQKIESGEILPDYSINLSNSRSRNHEDGWAIGSNGEFLPNGGDSDAAKFGDLPFDSIVLSHAHNNYGYRITEEWTVHYLPPQITEAQLLTIRELENSTRHYFCGMETGWQLKTTGTHCVQTLYSRDLNSEEREGYNTMTASLPILVSDWDIRTEEGGTIELWPYKRSTPQQKAIREKAAEVQELEDLLEALETESNQFFEAHIEAENDWLEREEADQGTAAIEDGTVFLVPAFRLEKFQDRESLEYGPFYDLKSGQQLKLILDIYSSVSSKITPESKNVLVKVRRRSNEQLHLFEGFLRPASGGRKQPTRGYFVIPILAPESFEAEHSEVEQKLKTAKRELEDLKAAPPQFEKIKKPKLETYRATDESSVQIEHSGGFNQMGAALSKLLKK